MGHIGDMHADFVVSVIEFLERKGIVKVLRILRVYGECQHITEVAAALEILCGDILGNPVGSVCNLRFKPVWKSILCKDCVHLGIILTRLSEHINDVSARAHLVARPVVYHSRHLHARAHLHLLLAVAVLSEFEHPVDGIHVITKRLKEACLILLLLHRTVAYLLSAVALLVRLCERYSDIIWHETTLHEHPCLVCDYMKNAYERLRRPLDNLHNLAFPPLAVHLLTGNGHAHGVAMQCTAGLRRLDKDIILLSIHNHECIALAGHLHPTCHLWEHLLFLLATAPAV